MGSKSNTKLHRDAGSFRTKPDKPSNYIVNKSNSNKMAVGFRRWLMVLTVLKVSSLLRRTRHKKLSYSRVRCNSLPGRFHPVVAGLHESAKALIGWTEEPA